VSLHDSALSMLVNVASNHLASGKDARRLGNGHPNIVPYTSYPASDGMIAVAVGNDPQFAKFAELLGHPEWAADARFVRNQDRVVNRGALDPLIVTALAADSVAGWIDRLRAAGIPCGPINTVTQALADPHAAARGMVVEMEHASAGKVRALGVPFRMHGTPATVRRAPPSLGEHTDAVLRDELGYDAARIAELRKNRIV
jgi:crotonobetainyl-CoA:carnitine CoA-transferase CaiB-like acyl-CoA transferase